MVGFISLPTPLDLGSQLFKYCGVRVWPQLYPGL
jgi:hypothetical protein